ncbi:hypothetical protein DKX38_027286 [Salix brachista]|uniref:Uncharacterized protein n=1 Tax=Salix brachista TaxID=2182728 RepID=A0A5N5JBM6_9ROSI|nr:hypothetical protein DKX38_027286 [Salix brachista]
MIKRRFFKAEHGEKDEASSDSSSSSDSEAEASGQSEDDVVSEPEDNNESEDDDTVAEPKEDTESEASLSSSGYESEDSSANAIGGDSSGRIWFYCVKHLFSIYDNETEDDRKTLTGIKIRKKQSNFTANKEAVLGDIQDCILKCKSVYKCRICPQTICLTEETMRAHLNSKRHARSEKLMKENKLKIFLWINYTIKNKKSSKEKAFMFVREINQEFKINDSVQQRNQWNFESYWFIYQGFLSSLSFGSVMMCIIIQR